MKSQLAFALSRYGAPCWVLETYHERCWIHEYISPSRSISWRTDQMYSPIHEWQHLSDLVLTHVTVTSLHISCCAVHVVRKSLQQYGEYWFYHCLIISDLGSAVRFLHSYMGCPPTSALSSFHARNKLLRYAWKWKCSTGHWPQKKNDPTGQSECWCTYINIILFSVFYFQFSVSLQ